MAALFANIEFYNTPDGDIMLKEVGRPARPFRESDRDIITEMLAAIRDRYPKAHAALMELYSRSTMNRWWYEYRVVHRFIRCNFGEYDQYRLDINHRGQWQFEEVHCPLRGDEPAGGCHCRGAAYITLHGRPASGEYQGKDRSEQRGGDGDVLV